MFEIPRDKIEIYSFIRDEIYLSWEGTNSEHKMCYVEIEKICYQIQLSVGVAVIDCIINSLINRLCMVIFLISNDSFLYLFLTVIANSRFCIKK